MEMVMSNQAVVVSVAVSAYGFILRYSKPNSFGYVKKQNIA